MATLISIGETWRCACGETLRVETFADTVEVGSERVLEADAYALGWKSWAPDHGDPVNAMCPDCGREEE